MFASLLVNRAFVGMKTVAGGGDFRHNGNPLTLSLKVLKLVQIRLPLRNARNSARAIREIAVREFHQPVFAPGHFRHVFAAEMVNKLVERVFRQTKRRQPVEQFLFEGERGFGMNLFAALAKQRLVFRFLCYFVCNFLLKCSRKAVFDKAR